MVRVRRPSRDICICNSTTATGKPPNVDLVLIHGLGCESFSSLLLRACYSSKCRSEDRLTANAGHSRATSCLQRSRNITRGSETWPEDGFPKTYVPRPVTPSGWQCETRKVRGVPFLRKTLSTLEVSAAPPSREDLLATRRSRHNYAGIAEKLFSPLSGQKLRTQSSHRLNMPLCAVLTESCRPCHKAGKRRLN